jgi:hypothetical protein
MSGAAVTVARVFGMCTAHPFMRRCAGLIALMAACALPAALAQPPAEPVDPLPVKRVSVTPDQVAREMERLGLTALERLSLDDFDSRLRRARAAARSGPQLVEARYFGAELLGDALVGKGRWKVLHSGPGAALLSLQPLSVALRQPRFDTREAIVADFEGSGTSLVVEEPGEQTVNFDWSARQEPGVDGMQFQLGLPPCAVATLELELPPELVLAADGVPVTGPLPAEKPDRRLWRLTFSRRPSVALTLRRRPQAADAPVVLAGNLLSRQRITAYAVEADFTFDHVRVLSGEVRELTCAMDPSLRPYEVTAPELDGWEVQPPAGHGQLARLVVRLREPLLSGSLVVRCSGPLGAETNSGRAGEAVAWTAPSLRLLGTVPGGETLLLHVQPDVSLDAWQPGEFHLVEARADADGQTLRLVGGLIAEAGAGAAGAVSKTAIRPSAHLQVHGTDFRARQLALWHVEPEHMALAAQITYEVLRGRLFRLALEVPAGYEVQRVETSPAGALRSWESRSARGASMLLVDLTQALEPETPLRLLLWLRPATSQTGVLSWPIPQLVPLGARWCEGGLAIDFDDRRFEGLINGSAISTRPPEQDGPWGNKVPRYYGVYRGEPLSGRIELRPLPPHVRTRIASSIVLGPTRATMETTLHLQADAGTPDTLDVCLSAAMGTAWHWQAVAGGNGVLTFDRVPALEAASRLHGLAASNSLGAALLLAASSQGEWWRLRLQRALQPGESLVLRANCDGGREPGGLWRVPLIITPTAEPENAEVVLHLSGADPVRIDAIGLSEAPSVTARGNAAAPWRTFHYGGKPAALVLSGAAPDAERASTAVTRAVLTTVVEPEGRLWHRFRFEVRDWPDSTFPLRLPTGARLLSVKVNGLWVAQVRRAVQENALLVDLPVPDSLNSGMLGELRRYEVCYATNAPQGWLGSRLESPAPSLPRPPLSFLRRWRLPVGLLPLSDNRVRPLPSANLEPDERARGPRDFRALSALVLRPLAFSDWESRQRQEIHAAARVGPPPLGRDYTLGEALERVACDASAEHDTLVIDGLALDEAGLTPATPVSAAGDTGSDSAPFWHAVGLIYVPCHPAGLLTTQRRRRAWLQAAGSESELVPPSVETAVAEAATNGHDTSGRFIWALDWVRRSPGASPRTPGGAPSDGAAPGWTEWEPLAGASDDAELITVRPGPIRAAGLGLTVALLAVAWALRRQPTRRKLGLLLVWLAAAAGSFFWLPASLQGLCWWPLVGAAVVGLSWYLWSAVLPATRHAKASSRPATRGATAAAALAVLAGGSALVSDAAPPAATRSIVLVVGAADAPERKEVLAPRELLRQLDALAAAGSPHGAVVTGAMYEGTVSGGAVELAARLHLHSYETAPVTLALPFADVTLQDDGLLDGAPAFLTAAPPGQPGLLVHIEKPGPHVLSMRFRAAVTASGSERELRLRLPRVPDSRMTLALPAGATHFQSPLRQGSLAPREADPAPRYTIELGRIDAPLLLHWHEMAGAPLRGAISLHEAYLWSLRPEAASLTAVFQTEATQGAPMSLALDMPELLEVQGIEARPMESGRPAPVLQAWHIETNEGNRRLRLDFAAPLTGGVCVVAHLLPRRPLAPLATLPLPSPVGATITRGLLACRTEGIEAQVADSARLRGPFTGGAGTPEQKALAEIWRTAGEGNLPPLAMLYGVQRDAGGQPYLRVRLRVPPPAVRGSLEVRWRLGERQADLRAVARLAPSGLEPALLEWEVPAEITVTRVGGRDGHEPVHYWSHNGNRVQAWLDRVPAGAVIQLEGWKDLTPERDGARFDVPVVRLLSAQASTAWVRLTTSADLAIAPESTDALLPLPDARASERDVSYAPRATVYGGRFHVRRIPASAEGRILTTIETAANRLLFTAHIEYRPEPGGGRGVEVRLRHWNGEARLDAPTALRRSAARHVNGEHAWQLDLPPGTTAALTLSGTAALPVAGAAAPDVTISGAPRLERWLVAGGPGLAAEDAQRLAAIPQGAELPATGRAEAARLQSEGATLWKIEPGDDWALHLRPRLSPPGDEPVRVALTERIAAVVDGQHWMHEAVLWLYHEANTNLSLGLSYGACVVSAAVDGIAVTPLRTQGDLLNVPLPGGAGVCRVRLRWTFDKDTESLDRPRLDRPRLRDAVDGPVMWTVHVPAAYLASFGPEESRVRMAPSSPALLDLARAEAQYRLCEALVAGPGTPPLPALALAQRRLYQFSRYAQAGRALTGASDGPANLRGQSFDQWLQDLKEKNIALASRSKFEELRARAEREASDAEPQPSEVGGTEDLAESAPLNARQVLVSGSDALPERGIPLRWQTGPETQAPALTLRPLGEKQTRRALGASLLLSTLLVLVWAVAQFPGILAWVRAFWPEQVALAGCIGLETWGPALPLLFLIALGGAARLLFLGRRLLLLLHRPPSDADRDSGSGSGIVVEPRPSGS